jgi:hypothetical protein
MGVTMNWIKEKLSTSNSIFNANGRLRNSEPRQFSNPLNPVARLKQGLSAPKDSTLARWLKKGKSGPRNEQAMLDGSHNQGIYRGNNVRVLSARLGLGDSNYSPTPKIRKGKPPEYLPERRHPETIAEAALGLPKGEALLIEVEHKKVKGSDPDSSGHAVAFYRSAGGTLYFFDPNAGVYRIPKAGDPPRQRRDNVEIARSLVPPGQRQEDVHAAPDNQSSGVEETNALRFVKRWLDIYDNAQGIKWKVQENDWHHGYSHIIPKANAKI